MVCEDRARQKISYTKQENYLSALLPPFQIVSRFSFYQVYRTMNKHLPHQTRFIRYTMKYILIVPLFGTVVINIFSLFLYKFGQNHTSFTKLKQLTI